MALRAKFKFESDVFFMILLRKIMKNTSLSKEYSAAEDGKIFFGLSHLFPDFASQNQEKDGSIQI
jgi:hypothetical protein